MSIARTQRLVALTFLATLSVSSHASLRMAADDASLSSSIEAALDASPALGAPSSIQVQSIDHVIYLHGLVETNPEKALVQSIAARTPGVTRVVNSLELRNE